MDKKKILLGIKIFVIISLIAQLGIFFYSFGGERSEGSLRWAEIFSRSNIYFLLVALGLSWLEGFIGGLRNYAIVKTINPRMTYLTSVKAEYGNIFLGAATPSQTGGGIAQIYFITRDGISISQATSGALLTFICTLLFLTSCLVTVSFFIPPNMAAHFHLMLKSAAIIVASFSSMFLFSVFFPGPISYFLAFIYKGIRRSGLWSDKKGLGKKGLEKIRKGLLVYRESVLLMIRRGKLAFLLGFICTCLFFAKRFVIPYFLLRGLGVEVNVLEVMYIQLLIILLNYFSPTPGAAGLAEVSSLILMGTMIQNSLAPIYTILWRFCTLYVNVTIGGIL